MYVYFSPKKITLTCINRCIVLVPYNENPDFVGRSDILEDLMQQFGYKQLQGSFKPRSRVSICGLGGIGYVLVLYIDSDKSNIL